MMQRGFGIVTVAVVNDARASGAWGAYIVRPASALDQPAQIYRSPGAAMEERGVDRLELLAMLAALKPLPTSAPLRIITRNQRLHAGLAGQIDIWRGAGWHTSQGTPLTHVALWLELDVALRTRTVRCFQ